MSYVEQGGKSMPLIFRMGTLDRIAIIRQPPCKAIAIIKY